VSGADLLARAERLRTGRMPFVLATVVRAQRPTSACPGDRALVLPDGTIEGFVGGSCARSTVLAQGLRLLAAGESGLLRISSSVSTIPAAPDDDGVITVANPCLSGGALEIFLEAMIPPPLVLVVGDAPVARALLRVGSALDYDVRAAADPASGSTTDPVPEIPAGTSAVVVASHGLDEEAVLRAALRAAVPYVALVASHRRGAAVLAALGLPDELTGRVSVPAGLDIGARSAPEIALSIYAELLASRPHPSPAPTAEASAATPEQHGCCAG
jgi:xanthine dehydrogenase accessory factor